MYSVSSHLNYLDLSAPKILTLVIINNLNIISPFVPTKTIPPPAHIPIGIDRGDELTTEENQETFI